ncbi:S-DNA-T family DNA segregation ATPase FtsK/SpoIIIE [Desulfobaculum xiamenense]|uniref:S-DNA-T family DNA segregation ATPase FtsK/SpoIIIE n=2 Tax=Desulfobaculum xiamenense TaxID=995050 RepID=A0A846QIE8_9BACT|nr:S-DNA-T family DNA segregation ATPase FtsK/SpoIIIE [Desulfobaculum xiamenense]
MALALAFWAVLLLVSLATYSPHDPSLNQAVSRGYVVKNAAGLIGAYQSDLLVMLFGLSSCLLPPALAALSAGNFVRRLFPAWWRWLGVFLFFLCLTSFGSTQWAREHLHAGDIRGGGLLGAVLYNEAQYYLRPTGAFLIWLFSTIVSLQLMCGMTWGAFAKRVQMRLVDAWTKFRERLSRSRRRQDDKDEPKTEEKTRRGLLSPKPRKKRVKDEPAAKDASTVDEEYVPNLGRAAAQPEPATPPAPKAAHAPIPTDMSGPPPIEYLEAPGNNEDVIPKDVLETKAKDLETCLSDFGIQGEVKDAVPGPVVTMFEYKPAPGVKISRIANLSDDLALALRASAVRIEAPLAGRDTVGVEIPNEKRQTVYLREIIESKDFQSSKSLLTLALGKDIYGRPRVADLAKMPHLLVAGATGQGKSVCLNCLLLSFLYKAAPDELKLLLVDPKRIELSVYSELPHLVHPVVTDMALAKNALDWAVYEMEKRYDSMAKLGVRNIEGFNAKLRKLGDDRPEGCEEMQPLPYLVIVIDELADLMLTARKEVETSIVRLAQLARAAGIHMILATQRPSVDVVTGLIKANFPSRIAFTVTSPQDSRTILDTVGANHLLGKGDMLFKPGGGKNVRVHGALVGEEEIGLIIDYWKAKAKPEFELDFGQWSKEGEVGGSNGDGPNGSDGIPDDPVYGEAVQFVMEQGKASISLIQRRFRIGFNRAARFVEQMEQDGVIGPADGSKPRRVITGRE